jgi:hypothetical protein
MKRERAGSANCQFAFFRFTPAGETNDLKSIHLGPVAARTNEKPVRAALSRSGRTAGCPLRRFEATLPWFEAISEDSVMPPLSPRKSNENPCMGGRLGPPHSRSSKALFSEGVQ